MIEVNTKTYAYIDDNSHVTTDANLLVMAEDNTDTDAIVGPSLALNIIAQDCLWVPL